jgi:hypothetical protein
VEWAAGESERQQQWGLDILASMAHRFAAAASSPHPLQIGHEHRRKAGLHIFA